MSKTGKSRLSRLLPKFLRGGDKKTDGGIDSKSPFCFIHFLDDSDHQMQIKGNWKGGALQEKVCELLNLHEKDYFGLRFIDASGQTHWLDGAKSLSSQFKGCQTPHKLYFGVKFYAADPCKLREEITRYLFFLQVKQDILQGRLPVTFDEASELCAYAVQSELGDFDPRQHTEGYVSEFCFVPNQTEDLEHRIFGLHRRMGGLVPLMAEYRYLDKVKWLDMYGVDLHPVLGECSVEYFLGLTPTGIVVYKNKNKVGNYFWPRISKVTFKGKIFIVKVKDKNNEEHVYAFELPRKTACKHLWKCCVEHHAFFRLNQTQERTSRENRVLRSVSSNRRSGRSERQAISDNLCKNSSSVNRLPSRRQPRRVSSDSRINAEEKYKSQYDGDTGMVTMMMRPQPVRAPRHRSLPELQGHESPRSTKSAPWETNFDYGLYTQGKESPVSERSNKAREHRNRPLTGSDSESGISHRRKYFPNRRGSDNDSDVSVTRRRRRDMDSDSASDVSSRYPASQGNERRHHAFPVLYPFHDKENRPNGSIPSLHSAPAGEAKQRRRRRRSKSPSKRPPDELKQHFEYDLKDPDGLSTDELREIPFVNIETKASVFKLKYSPKLRQKVKAAKQKSLVDVDQNRNQVTRKQNSLPLQDDIERDMSVRSQPLPWKSSGDRHTVSSNHSMVDDSRVQRQPLSLHQPQTQTPYSDTHPPPHIPARPHSQLYHSAPKHADSETDSRAKPRSDAGDNYSKFRSDAGDNYARLRSDTGDNYAKLGPDTSDNYAKPRPDAGDNYAKLGPDTSDNYAKPRPDAKSPPSKVPSDLLYQPSQAPRVQRLPQEQYDFVKQREGHAAPQSSRSSHANPVPRNLRPPSDNDTQLKSANGSAVTPQYSRSPNENAAPRAAVRSALKHAQCRSSDVESNRPQHVSSCRSARSHHRHSLSRNHPHLQAAYDSDVSSSVQRPREQPPHQSEASRTNASRYSGRYSGEQQHQEQDFVYSDGGPTQLEYEPLQPQQGADAWKEGSRSGQRGEGRMSSGYQYREDSPQQAHSMGPPPTSRAPPSGYEGRHHGNSNVSYSSMSSPPQSYHQYHQHQHQHQHQHPPPPPSTYPNQSYPYGPRSHTSPPANAHYDQGQRPRSYGQEEGSRLMPPPYGDDRLREEQERSRLYGGEEGQQGRYQGEGERSRASFRDVRPRAPRNQYEGEGQQLYDYHSKAGFAQGPPYHHSPQPYRQPSPQPPNHSTPPRHQGTPPRHQGTPPRHQGTPPRYQGTPPRYQGTPSKQSVSGTPPRQNLDPRYSQGLLSGHAREHSEGSSSQASARGPGSFHRAPHQAQHAQGAMGSARPDARSVGNSLTPEQARQLLKSSNYNPDLCTEL